MATPDLGHKIGPLPLGAWIAVVGGGLAIGMWRRRSAGTSSSTAAPEVLNDTTTQAGVGGSPPIPPTVTDTAVPSVGSTTRPQLLTNDQWLTEANRQLSAAGASPYWVNNYLSQWLNGRVATANPGGQQYTIDWANRLLGPPPEQVPLPEPGTYSSVAAASTVRDSSTPLVAASTVPRG